MRIFLFYDKLIIKLSAEGRCRMSYPDRSIDPRLLATAKEEFLKKGYEMASLADICSAAGVTTGALYKRYKGKEELFAAVVADTIQNLEVHASKYLTEDLEVFSDRELYESFGMSPDVNLKWLSILYENKEGFILIIRCSQGTRYGNFQHDWAEKVNAMVYRHYLEARRRGMTEKIISLEEMHVLSSAIWTMFYEPFIHDFTWEQMKKHAYLIHQFADWYNVLGIRKPE